jgi:hypothetical protein
MFVDGGQRPDASILSHATWHASVAFSFADSCTWKQPARIVNNELFKGDKKISAPKDEGAAK